jgi:hypothetical protein
LRTGVVLAGRAFKFPINKTSGKIRLPNLVQAMDCNTIFATPNLFSQRRFSTTTAERLDFLI